MKISEVIIKDRIRKDMGDLVSLEKSIHKLGLLHPIVVSSDNVLIAGRRRLEACKNLEWEDIDVKIINLEEPRDGEVEENQIREDFTPSEAYSIAEFYKPIIAEENKQKQERKSSEEVCSADSAEQNCSNCDKTVTPVPGDGIMECPECGYGLGVLGIGDDDEEEETPKDTRVAVAAKTGYSHDTLMKIKAIEEEAITNPKIAKAWKKLNDNWKTKDPGKRGASINSIFKQINMKEKNLIVRDIPKGEFDLIYIDPPWESQSGQTRGTPEQHYNTMDDNSIINMKLPMADDCIVFLWTIASMQEQAFECLKSWGLQYKTHMIWDKETIGVGYWTRTQHEVLFIATKGKVPAPDPSMVKGSVYREKKTKHSAKPEYFYKLIESYYPVRKKLEMFARNKREGWESWGNEIE